MKIKFSKVWVVVLLFLALFVNAIDRTNISVAATSMMHDLHINATVMGLIMSSFFWAYLVFNIPGGALADRFGSKWVYAISATIWSVATILTGVFRSVTHIIFSRIFVGVGEAASFPIGTKVINEAFTPEQRGTATGVYLSGLRVGMAAAPVFVAWIISKYSWHEAFTIAGLISLIWVALWLTTYRPSGNGEIIKSKKKEKSAEEKAITQKLLKKKDTWAIIFIKFFQDYLYYLFVTWLPGYLIMQRHFSIIKMGIFAALPWIVGALIQPIIGVVSDRLIAVGVNRTIARKVPMIVMQFFAASVILTGYINSPMAAVWLCIIGVAAESGSTAMLWTIPSELAPKGAGGTLGGLMNTAGALAGIVSPIITGWLVVTTKTFNAAFAVAGIGIIVAALLIIFFLGEIKPMKLDDDMHVNSKLVTQ